MTATLSTYSHITVVDAVPIIAGTTMKVVELVMAQRAHGWSPEELRFQFPSLSLGQIHAALGYYWDNQEALDADILRRLDLADASRAQFQNPVAARLRALRDNK